MWMLGECQAIGLHKEYAMTRIMMAFSYIPFLFTKIQAGSERLEESIFQCISIPSTKRKRNNVRYRGWWIYASIWLWGDFSRARKEVIRGRLPHPAFPQTRLRSVDSVEIPNWVYLYMGITEVGYHSGRGAVEMKEKHADEPPHFLSHFPIHECTQILWQVVRILPVTFWGHVFSL